MTNGPQVSATPEFSPDIPKSEWYKDGDSWYKTVLEIEWQSGIIVPCETVNRHLAGPERGRLSLCFEELVIANQIRLCPPRSEP